MALTDAPGNLVNLGLRPGQPRDTVGVAGLSDGADLGGLIADKAFDVNSIVEELDQRGAGIVISQHPNRVAPREIDTEACKWRHLIENFSVVSKTSNASHCGPARPTAVSRQ